MVVDTAENKATGLYNSLLAQDDYSKEVAILIEAQIGRYNRAKRVYSILYDAFYNVAAKELGLTLEQVHNMVMMFGDIYVYKKISKHYKKEIEDAKERVIFLVGLVKLRLEKLFKVVEDYICKDYNINANDLNVNLINCGYKHQKTAQIRNNIIYDIENIENR